MEKFRQQEFFAGNKKKTLHSFRLASNINICEFSFHFLHPIIISLFFFLCWKISLQKLFFCILMFKDTHQTPHSWFIVRLFFDFALCLWKVFFCSIFVSSKRKPNWFVCVCVKQNKTANKFYKEDWSLLFSPRIWISHEFYSGVFLSSWFFSGFSLEIHYRKTLHLTTRKTGWERKTHEMQNRNFFRRLKKENVFFCIFLITFIHTGVKQFFKCFCCLCVFGDFQFFLFAFVLSKKILVEEKQQDQLDWIIKLV